MSVFIKVCKHGHDGKCGACQMETMIVIKAALIMLLENSSFYNTPAAINLIEELNDENRWWY